ncbi:hypothetical protein D3C84_764050 [compost metagenome]
MTQEAVIALHLAATTTHGVRMLVDEVEKWRQPVMSGDLLRVIQHALQQRQALMQGIVTTAIDVTLVITGRNRGMANLVDLFIALIDPLDDVLIPQHAHTPEQIDESLRPRRTLY